MKRSSKDSNVPFQICLPSPPRASPLLFESFRTLAQNGVPSVQHGRLRGCRIVALLAPLEELAPFQALVVVLIQIKEVPKLESHKVRKQSNKDLQKTVKKKETDTHI